MAVDAAFEAHLKTATTSVCRCWSVARQDGTILGFTDHDADLSFDGLTYRASTGLAPRSLHQTTGLSVDNSEALGILSDDAVRAEDITAGRYDKAVVTAWLVNWQAPDQRHKQFQGTMGEISHSEGTFTVELRGLAEALNQPQGRFYQKTCSALLGDARCTVDMSNPAYVVEVPAAAVLENQSFRFAQPLGFDEGWFSGGRLQVLSGKAEGLLAVIKSDQNHAAHRELILWESVRADVHSGDLLRLYAGCDKREETCRLKFFNYENYRGFPHIPGEDWLLSYPVQGDGGTGGKLAR